MIGRVDYLLAPNYSGQYHNPFDQGCMGNCLARFSGTHDTPPPGLVARLRASGGGLGDNSSSVI